MPEPKLDEIADLNLIRACETSNQFARVPNGRDADGDSKGDRLFVGSNVRLFGDFPDYHEDELFVTPDTAWTPVAVEGVSDTNFLCDVAVAEGRVFLAYMTGGITSYEYGTRKCIVKAFLPLFMQDLMKKRQRHCPTLSPIWDKNLVKMVLQYSSIVRVRRKRRIGD